MRSIWTLGKKMTGWQVLPVDAPDFEKAALRACELVIAKDPRVGKGAASAAFRHFLEPTKAFRRTSPFPSNIRCGLRMFGPR